MNTFALILSLLLLACITAIVLLIRAIRKKGTNAEVLGLQGKLTDMRRKYKDLESSYISLVNGRKQTEKEINEKLNTDSGRDMLTDLESRR